MILQTFLHISEKNQNIKPIVQNINVEYINIYGVNISVP